MLPEELEGGDATGAPPRAGRRRRHRRGRNRGWQRPAGNGAPGTPPWRRGRQTHGDEGGHGDGADAHDGEGGTAPFASEDDDDGNGHRPAGRRRRSPSSSEDADAKAQRVAGSATALVAHEGVVLARAEQPPAAPMVAAKCEGAAIVPLSQLGQAVAAAVEASAMTAKQEGAAESAAAAKVEA